MKNLICSGFSEIFKDKQIKYEKNRVHKTSKIFSPNPLLFKFYFCQFRLLVNWIGLFIKIYLCLIVINFIQISLTYRDKDILITAALLIA